MTHDAEPSARADERPALVSRLAQPGVIALGVSLVALAVAGAPYVTDGGPFGARVRAYLLENPQILDEVVQARQLREQSMITDQINQAASANADLLAHDPRDPAVGPADAAVTVIEFFDYRCPGCKAVSADVLRIVRANPDVRFVFKEWPILDRGEDTTSNYAARAALAAHAQGRYLPVHQALMAAPALTPEEVDRVLEANGVDLSRARAILAADDTSRHLADIQIAAETLRLQGTPTFLVNGRATDSIRPQDLAAAIAEAKRGA